MVINMTKTSKAIVRSVRINPDTSKEDADMLAIIEQLEQDGFTFKQIVQDAILRSAGHTPEMYSRNSGFFILGSIEEMLSKFANEVISNVRGSGGISKPELEVDEGEISPFAKRMAKSFMQRQQNKGDE